MRNSRFGFTLIEVLVVIAIIGILVALLLPAVQAAREAGRRVTCWENLSQLILAVQSYEMSHATLPPGSIDPSARINNDAVGYHHGWITQILPMLEEVNTYQNIDRKFGVYAARNVPVRTLELPLLLCPSSPDHGAFSNYAGVNDFRETPITATNSGVFMLNRAVRVREVTDGLSHTLFIGEKSNEPGYELGWISGSRATMRNFGAFGRVSAAGTPISSSSLRAEEGMPVFAPNDWGLLGLQPNAADLIAKHDAGDAQPPGAPMPRLRAGPFLFVGGFESEHPGGLSVAIGDGSVRFISEHIDPRMLSQLVRRDDGSLMVERDW